GKRVPFIDQAKGDANQGPESSALGVLVRKPGAPPGARPGDGALALADGTEDSTGLQSDDYVGAPIPRAPSGEGLSARELDPYRDVALVYAPAVDTDIAKKIVAHCENLRFRFAVIDSEKGKNNLSELAPRNAVTDSQYAAFYYPWIMTSDPRSG